MIEGPIALSAIEPSTYTYGSGGHPVKLVAGTVVGRVHPGELREHSSSGVVDGEVVVAVQASDPALETGATAVHISASHRIAISIVNDPPTDPVERHQVDIDIHPMAAAVGGDRTGLALRLEETSAT